MYDSDKDKLVKFTIFGELPPKTNLNMASGPQGEANISWGNNLPLSAAASYKKDY